MNGTTTLHKYVTHWRLGFWKGLFTNKQRICDALITLMDRYQMNGHLVWYGRSYIVAVECTPDEYEKFEKEFCKLRRNGA